MKSLKLLYLSAPVTACLLHSFDGFRQNTLQSCPVLQAEEQQMKLEQVQIVFRHGARTPTSWTKEKLKNFNNIVPQTWDKYNLMCGEMANEFDMDVKVQLKDGNAPSEPTFEESHGKEMKGGCFTGQLTLVGQQQLHDLGKLIAEKYINTGFISSSYNKDEVYIRTSHYQRTIMSVTALLSGLYGKDRVTEPILLETKRIKDEDIFGNIPSCSKFGTWFIQTFAHLRNPLDEKEFVYLLNKLIGKKENARNSSVISVNDLIRCRKAHGHPVPQYLLDNRDLINEYELKSMNVLFGKGRSDILRSNIGSFLETICYQITEAIDKSRKTKLFLYSAHDWTIFSLLIAFDVEVKVFPKFGASLIMELYRREDGQRFIRVLLDDEPIILDKEDNEEYLSVEKFFDLVQSYRVLDLDKECGNVSN